MAILLQSELLQKLLSTNNTRQYKAISAHERALGQLTLCFELQSTSECAKRTQKLGTANGFEKYKFNC